MPEQLEANVPKTTPINWGVRDLRPYVGEEEEELMDEELYPHQKYEMGVVPSHFRRALKSGMTVGALNALGGTAGTLYGAATGGGSDVLSGVADSVRRGAQQGASAVAGAMKGPVTLPTDIRDSVQRQQEIAEAQAQGRVNRMGGVTGSAMEGMNLGFSLLGAVPTIQDAVNQYRKPGKQTAKTVSKRLAKAKRKRDRRNEDMSLLEGYLYRPFRDKAEAQTAVEDGEKEDEFEIAFAPGG